jgi:ubiquinone/menaquinone biosynthesis C-methylase UbiE
MAVTKNYDPKKFREREYDFKSRWASYWYQINEVLDLNPKNVLEVGIGSKTVADYLEHKNIEVVTLDINKELDPDIVASVLKMPLKDHSFDVVLCAEVLEHLSFDDFEKCLEELQRVTRRYLVLSLPHFGPQVKLLFKLPFLKEKKLAFKIPVSIGHKFTGKHYWEIGKKGYPLSRIRNMIKSHFEVRKEFIPFENQYHHFFILEKK